MKLDDSEFRVRIPPRLINKESVIERLSAFADRLIRSDVEEDAEETIGRIVAAIYEYPIEGRELEDLLRAFEVELNLVPYTLKPDEQSPRTLEIIRKLIKAMTEDVEGLRQRLSQIERRNH